MSASVPTPRCTQFFGPQGECLTAPLEVPPHCAAAAKTGVGKTVCDRGCGFSFAPGTHGEKFRTFTCPFGVSNAMLAVGESSDAPESGNGGKPRIAARMLVGGRMFRNYAQFSAFVDKVIELGASPEEALKGCERLRFQDPETLRQDLERIAAAGIPAQAPEPARSSAPATASGPKKGSDSAFASGAASPLGAGFPASAPEHASRVSRPLGIGTVVTRYAFERRFRTEMERSARFKRPLSLALIRVNMDRWTGASEDRKDGVRKRVLQGVAGVFKPLVRVFDLVANYQMPGETREGEEVIALMFPETTRLAADAAVRRALPETHDQFLSEIRRREGLDSALSLEVGLAEYPADGATFRELLEVAKGGLDFAPLDVDMQNESIVENRDFPYTGFTGAVRGTQKAAPEVSQGEDSRT